MATKEFTVLRKATISQSFTVKAETAAEAQAIIEAEEERLFSKGVVGAEWDMREEDVRDRRVTWVGEPSELKDATFFIRTTDWVPA